MNITDIYNSSFTAHFIQVENCEPNHALFRGDGFYFWRTDDYHVVGPFSSLAIADDFRANRCLNTVTLVALTSNHIEGALKAITKCCSGLQFRNVLFMTDAPEPDNLAELKQLLRQPFQWIAAPAINDVFDYGNNVVFELPKHIDTGHALICHHDGYVVNPQSWTHDFLAYDYVGAPWPVGLPYRVGNGGFCLRSHKLLQAIMKHEQEFRAILDARTHYEDYAICGGAGRPILEAEGCVWPSVELAAQFAHETPCPETINSRSLPFGVHGPAYSLA